MLMRLKNVKVVRSKGRPYYYHRPTMTRIKAAYGTPEFVREVERLNAKVEKAASGKGSLGALVEAYRASPEFAAKADSTKADYLDVLDWLAPIYDMPLSAITTPFVMKLRNKAHGKRKRRFANYVIQVLSLLFNWGKPNGFGQDNPAAEAPKIERPRGARDVNRPWRDVEFATVLKAMPPELRVAVALGAYAGLREGDALRITWSAYDGEAIESRQAKTGDPLWVPAHQELRPVLDDAKCRAETRAKAKPGKPVAVTIVVGARGRPFTESGFRARFFKIIRELTATGKVQPGLTFHGLRHTAATKLADAGCDTRDIMAITGHKTEAMVARYTKRADQRRRATSAMAKLEQAANTSGKLDGKPLRVVGGTESKT